MVGRASAIRPAGAVGGVCFVGLTLALLAPQTIHITHRQDLNSGIAQQPKQWPRPIIPLPINPMVSRSLGGAAPSAPHADAGIIHGAAMTPEAAALPKKPTPRDTTALFHGAPSLASDRLVLLKNSTHLAISGMESSQL